MKSEVSLALENAGWPVLVVDTTGVIHGANPAAAKLFGPLLEGGAPGLAAIWAPGNSIEVEPFLAQWERAGVPMALLKFRSKADQAAPFLTAVSVLTHEGGKFFIFQLLQENAAPTTPAGMDSGLALRQKLDCALQLARTVALDFNNALTSILGHTSLILSKMEPNHPWRESLIEVEKSASKAAEIANEPAPAAHSGVLSAECGARAAAMDASTGPEALRREVRRSQNAAGVHEDH
jgi:nitrogen-specific signal transduction histidine kinase